MKNLTRVQFFGAFSPELKNLIASKAEGRVVNLCSGSWHFGVTLDLIQPADIKADVQAIPLRDHCADTVIFDPPFSKKFRKQYGAYYANRRQVFKEVLRILKPGGLLIFSHYFIPQLRPLTTEEVYLVVNRPWEHARVLSFSRKQQTLCDIYTTEKTAFLEAS